MHEASCVDVNEHTMPMARAYACQDGMWDSLHIAVGFQWDDQIKMWRESLGSPVTLPGYWARWCWWVMGGLVCVW